MKITNTYQSIPQTTEKELQTGEYKGPKSLPDKPKIESRVDKYEGPDELTNRIIFPIPDPNIPAFANDPVRTAAESVFTQFVNEWKDERRPRPTLPVDKYKGPESIIRQELESKVDQYKGPDSIQRPQRGSEVEKYKGPKSLPGEPEIESRVDKYKGPDSAQKQTFELPPLPNLPGPDAADAAEWFRNILSSDDTKTVEYKASDAGLEVKKYKGPDSLVESEKKK